MVENEYPVPSYLADVFQKPDEWIETPQVATDAEGPHAIDCELTRLLIRSIHWNSTLPSA